MTNGRNEHHRVAWALTAALLAAGSVGLGLLVSDRSGPGSRVGPGLTSSTTSGVHGPPAYRLTSDLTSFGGCTDYLDYVRSQAETEVGAYGLQPPGAPRSLPGGVSVGGMAVPAVSGAPSAAAGVSAGTAMSAAGGGATASASTPAGLPQSATFSQTDDQVAGVDEPDTLKTDGRIVVTLQGPTLHVIDSSAHMLGSVQLPGDTGGGLLLDGNQAVVLSSLSSSGPSPVSPIPLGAPAAGASRAILPGGRVSGSAAPATRMASATVVDLSHPAHPTLVRTFLFDGTLVAARLVGGQIRLIDRTDGPRITFVYPSTNGDSAGATAANRSLVAGSTVDQWLPAWQVQTPDGAVSPRRPITSCDSVARPKQADGLSTVTLFTLDPSASTPGAGTSVVAAGDTVYATADHVYVAGESLPAQTGSSSAAPAQYGCCTLIPPQGSTTDIYAFDTPAKGPPVFTGSGTVAGWLVNSYAMDETPDGLLRVASTEMTGSGSSDARISVLRPSGGALVTVGSVAGLGRGEAIRAVRYIGDEAYLVTYQSFDPLYVVDLKDPAAPVVTGELDQPGFSEFLYPLPGNRLLGVGVQITDNEPSGLVVATYDVSDPAHPRRIDESPLTTGTAWYGNQTYDPHAFLYWPATSLALLATPGTDYSQSGSAVAAYTIGGGGSLTRSATIGHGSDEASRSAVVDGQVWVVTSGGIITAGLDDLATSSWHPY